MSEQKGVVLPKMESIFDWDQMKDVAADDLCTPEEHPEHEVCMACLAIRGTRWALSMRKELQSRDAQIAAMTARVEELSAAKMREMQNGLRMRNEGNAKISALQAELAALRDGAKVTYRVEGLSSNYVWYATESAKTLSDARLWIEQRKAMPFPYCEYRVAEVTTITRERILDADGGEG